MVTLQPTSPTLSADTLDNAIRYAIDNGLDTVISVINAPHLSWRKENGKTVPNYEKRLNRQYLPPNYLETGAFVVARRAIMTESTRIGPKIDVFEVPERESVDVDTFDDLLAVDHILSAKRVGIYVNGNNTRGIGHIYRALELADEFFTKPDIYYDVNQTDPKVFGTTTHRLIGVNGIAELFEKTRTNQYDIFINDILMTTVDYMIALRTTLPHATLVNFEDDGEGSDKADLVFNALYSADAAAHIKGGEEYYISPKLFMFYEPAPLRETVKRVFVCFGGADPQNYTDRLLSMASSDEYKAYDFTFVLGRAKQNVEQLMAMAQGDHIRVLYDVRNMPELMVECDVALTSRGRTGYELAMLGVPTIAMSQNAREEKHGFVCRENGFTYLGTNPSDHVIKSTLDMYLTMAAKERAAYRELMLATDLRHGRKRVMNLIQNLR